MKVFFVALLGWVSFLAAGANPYLNSTIVLFEKYATICVMYTFTNNINKSTVTTRAVR